MSELDKVYKQAVVKIARDIPELIRAMYALARALNTMPRSQKIHF